MQNKPDFIVPGFPKCGTTWLYDRLRELPDFDMPSHKEFHFFNSTKKYNGSKPIGSGSQHYLTIRKRLLRIFNYSGISFGKLYLNIFLSNEKLYLALFNKKKKLTGDITPRYFGLSPTSVNKISKLLGKTKVIFILRDPIDRCWSECRKKLLDKREMKLKRSNYQKIFNFLDRKIQYDYCTSICKYSTFFKQKSIMITYYDVLKDNPRLFLTNIVEFLGGNPSYISKYSRINQYTNVAPKAEIPRELYDYLLGRHEGKMKELAENYGGYCLKWYNLHYDNTYPVDDNDQKSFLII